jgi:hypothetical protein
VPKIESIGDFSDGGEGRLLSTGETIAPCPEPTMSSMAPITATAALRVGKRAASG